MRLLMLFCLTLSVSLTAQPPAPKTPAPPTAQAIASACKRGVAILLERQESLDGKDVKAEWPYEGVYRVRTRQGRQIPIGYRIGGTSICAWALLEAPGWDADQARQAAVKRALDFVLEGLKNPLMKPDFERGYDVRGWGHAYALNFLLRLRALKRVPQSRTGKTKKAIRSLVKILQDTEIEDVGGWNYSRRGRRPRPSTFMTAPTLQFLFTAAAQGEKVKRTVVRRALKTLEDARLETGAFQYGTRPDRKTGKGFEAVPGAIGRMPVCESTLLLAGRGSVERLRKSLAAFFEHWEWLEKRRKQNGTHVRPYMIAPYYFYYAHYYVAQAIELLPENERQGLRDRNNALLFRVREASGGWNDRVFDRSENFGTAMAILALLQPHASLPAKWKKKRGA